MAGTTNLEAYIKTQNAWRDLFSSDKVASLEIPTTVAQAETIIEQLECDLSPENLCCDGELRGPELNKKSAMLNAAYSECMTLMLDLP